MMMQDQIRIRPFRRTDIDAVFDAVTESIAELAPWMPWCHPGYSREETTTWVENRDSEWESRTAYSFVIEAHDGRVLGSCGLNRFDWPGQTANLGYWVRTSATRLGVATQAVGLLSAWAFAETELYRLEILAALGNVGSQRVAQKSGAVFEGILRQRLMLHDRRHDAVLFSILRPNA
jgi:RimJ/RimL family protein N-acetyltransferase